MSQIRHPTKKKSTFPPTPDTLISNGNDKKILEGMHKFSDKISNTRRFSNDIKVARSTVKDRLKELINKGYVEKPVLGVYILTDKGKQIVLYNIFRLSYPVGLQMLNLIVRSGLALLLVSLI